ncbi:MAG: class I SAM-dependent methyltransferase [Bacteroidetes bacterium]|nr:class I SAM-dependent methyltransferase [Bacteroidota bacterium]
MITMQPDNTAVRTALWRALHVLQDEKPFIIEDTIGYKLIKPKQGWEEYPDMKYTKRLRASIVARARFIEDLAKEQIRMGINQYVLLGAGLDSFAQRNPEITEQVNLYEIDQPGTLFWKEKKLIESNYHIPGNLHFVPVDFETTSWWEELLKNGFDIHQPAIVSCTGVTLYLTKKSITDMLRKTMLFSPGSTIAIAFYLSLENLEEEDKPLMEMAIKGAAASGTPFLSFYTEVEIAEQAKTVGLKNIKTISTKDMTEKYFKNRTDNLLPASGEFFLVAQT